MRFDRTARILFHTNCARRAKRPPGSVTIPEVGLGVEDRSLGCRERAGSIRHRRALGLCSHLRACVEHISCAGITHDVAMGFPQHMQG